MKNIVLFLSYSLAGASKGIFEDEYCKVLALRGGGTNGAFEIGILKKMIEYLDPEDYAYDVFQGVSIGGINAAIMASYEKGHEKEATEWLEDAWLSNPVNTFWEWWPVVGPLQGLWRKSLIDNTKMLDFIHHTFDNREFKRAVVLEAVDLNTGEIVIFDETVPAEHRAWAIAASASIPLVFPPISQINPYQMLVDGGAFSNVEMDEAILKCREKGFDDEHIIVDLILCFDKVVEV
jgi:predicted acylesterase/phospholipase RssA